MVLLRFVKHDYDFLILLNLLGQILLLLDLMYCFFLVSFVFLVNID